MPDPIPAGAVTREPRETIAEALMGQYNYFGRWFAMADIVLAALASSGMVVVSAEDLDILLNRGDQAVGWQRYSEACNRLRAALPEEKTDV